jgi:cytochrome oxidase assembly protein ShyY1
MRGKGPTRPSLDPDTVFTYEPLQTVAVAVEAKVNGEPATCPNAAGWPGTADPCRRDVTLRGSFEGGKAILVANRTYIPGIPFEFPVKQ